VKSLTAIIKTITPLILALSVAGNAIAQADQMDKFIEEMLDTHRDKTLCVEKSSSVESIRSNLVSFLRTAGVQNTVTTKYLAIAMWSIFPCPFSPIRQELRPATEKDIEGVWLFPETSQKLRFPPQSPRQSPVGRMPVKCDAVGYYPGGELRHAIVAGENATCPFVKANDLDAARRNPKVSTWTFLSSSRIGVTRTDVQNHIEQWDVFFVAKPFAFGDVQFSTGDLVAYLRKENGNDVGIASQFRHLKRLP